MIFSLKTLKTYGLQLQPCLVERSLVRESLLISICVYVCVCVKMCVFVCVMIPHALSSYVLPLIILFLFFDEFSSISTCSID